MNIGEKIKEYLRVMKVTKKPDKNEMMDTFRICMIGIGIIGLIGFLFYMLSSLLPTGL